MPDPARLARLHAACFTAAPPPWSADAFRTLLAQPHVHLEDSPHGFALWRAAGGESELLTLAIAPDARRQGHAAALMRCYHRHADALGARAFFLEVAATNRAAIALYRRCGYRRAGLRRGYYAAPDGTAAVDALVMTRGGSAGAGGPEII